MKQLLSLLSLVLFFGWSPPTDAASCGTSRRPSLKRNCQCSSLVRRGTFLGRFKKKFRFRLRRECRNIAKIAKRQCRRRYARRSGRVLFRWRRVRSYVRNVMGYKTGFCKIRYSCMIRRKKVSGLRLLHRVFRVAGMSKVKRTSPRQSKTIGALLGRKNCARKHGHVVSFKVTKLVCKAKQCQVSWQCFFRKRRRVYWCK